MTEPRNFASWADMSSTLRNEGFHLDQIRLGGDDWSHPDGRKAFTTLTKTYISARDAMPWVAVIIETEAA